MYNTVKILLTNPYQSVIFLLTLLVVFMWQSGSTLRAQVMLDHPKLTVLLLIFSLLSIAAVVNGVLDKLFPLNFLHIIYALPTVLIIYVLSRIEVVLFGLGYTQANLDEWWVQINASITHDILLSGASFMRSIQDSFTLGLSNYTLPWAHIFLRYPLFIYFALFFFFTTFISLLLMSYLGLYGTFILNLTSLSML